MLGIFIGSFDESNKEFKMNLNFIARTEVSSTKSKIVTKAIECTLHENDTGIMKTFFMLRWNKFHAWYVFIYL